MQEDSPGNREKRKRNERYNTPTRPKKLSVSAAKQKAKEYAAKDDKSTRVLAKQAILKELSSHLVVRARGVTPQNRKKADETENDSEPTKASNIKEEERKPVKFSSKIPRRVDGAHSGAAHKRWINSISQHEQKRPHQETALSDNSIERFQSTRRRFLAKKYLLIWRKKTYGRVTPVTARGHYERKLMQRTLQVWQDIWWSGRRGWKLNVRADYHNRYRLWQKSWKAWREYISYCRTKKTRDKLAHHQAHHALLAKCWSGWKEYIGTRRRKRQQTDRAMDLAENQLKRRAWDHWLAQLAFKENLQYMDHEALQFWATSLMTKAWKVWTSACLVKTDEKEKMRVASRFNDKMLLLRVWRGLKNYKSVRKLKQLRHGAASRHFSLELLKKSFHMWVTRWQRQVELAQFDDLINYKGDVAVARRAFVHWKYYIVLKHEEYENEDIAAHHYTEHLLKTCFNALHLQAVQRRLKEMRLKMAEDLQQRFQLQRVWNVWLRRCEHSEELKLHSVSRKARAHHNFQLKRKLFTIWVKYCQWRRFRKSQYGKADYHFRERALPRYFCRIMIFVDLMHSNKETNLAAEKFRGEALLAKTFYSWWSKYQLMMDVRMMERMAILHNDEVIKRRSLQFWLQQARKKLHERQLEAVADDHHNRKLLQMGIGRWREFNNEMKQSRSVQHSSVRHYYVHLLKKTWAAWQQFVRYRQVKWQKQARANLHYQQRLLSLVTNAWKDHHNHAKAVETHCDERLQAHNLDRLRSAFETWRQNVVENREERRNKHVAKTLFNQTILSKCFTCWREFSTHHAVKKWLQWQRLHEIQQKLERGKLKRSFRAWKSFKMKSVHDKALRNKACEHHNKTLLGKAVLAWKGYIHLSFRIKILQRQSMWLHNRRITAAFFRKWKNRHGIVMQEKRQTVLALWHWSVSLQRKAFYALLEYAIVRKRKAVRIARALEERRNRLLRTGVTQWMKVGFYLASERSRLAQERQLEVAHSVHQCVYRCAMHWRRVTANRVRQRGGKPRPRRVIEPKPDWPIATLSETTRPVPSVPPSTYSMEVHRIALEGFKERPRPRKPDYLRESFDLTQISTSKSVTPRVHSTRVTEQVEDDETKPRASPPRPSYQMGSNIHPNQRNPREESIVFPSSSGDESFLGAEGAEKNWTRYTCPTQRCDR
ncbi:hypothetical protein ACROYT_G006331 [Oculina patagonica]